MRRKATYILLALALAFSFVAYLNSAPEAEAQNPTRFRALFVEHDLDVGGDAEITGDLTLTGSLAAGNDWDLNGNKLDLDADADTSLTADTDDQIDIELGGTDQITLKTVAAADSAATNNLAEIFFSTPADTTGTNTHNALTIDLAIGNATGGTNAVNGIQIDAITGDAQVSETAINIGSGWDTGINVPQDTENIGLPTVVSTAFTYTAAAGGTGTVATVAAGEVWVVHAAYVNVTTNFDATGDDVTLDIGDGNDADGLLVLVDGELQAADTEGTGAPAGWQGFMSTDTVGAYLAQGLGFVYVGPETIDWVLDETSGETITAGAATVYLIYTRLQ